MVNEIHVSVRGNAAGDATLRKSENGTLWATFRIGSTARKFDQRLNSWADGTTQWFNVKIFGRTAEFVAASVRKGSPILVRGVLVTEEWVTKEGEQRTSHAILADSVALEMSRGATTYMRLATSENPSGAAFAGASDPSARNPFDVVAPDEIDPVPGGEPGREGTEPGTDDPAAVDATDDPAGADADADVPSWAAEDDDARAEHDLAGV